MKQIIPFKKELPFKTKVSEITSISLEREISVENEGIVTGVFHITGDYKMNEGSINRESFSFDLPFDITLDPRYDVSTVMSDIEDFYYDVINEDTLKVNIDLFVEAQYLPEKEFTEVREETEKISEIEIPEVITEPQKIEIKRFPEEELLEDRTISNVLCKEDTINELVSEYDEERINIKKIMPQKEDDSLVDSIPSIASDLFSNLDDTETYTTYYVYIVKEDDTIDKILTKYGVTKEELEAYNDLAEIKPGDKVIVPKICE